MSIEKFDIYQKEEDGGDGNAVSLPQNNQGHGGDGNAVSLPQNNQGHGGDGNAVSLQLIWRRD